jgi:catechol 2,3-dioxygenase-like lactoylglutathione lyase family enzyme
MFEDSPHANLLRRDHLEAYPSPRLPRISREGQVISGAHVIVYSKDAEADRAFFRDVLGFKSVDAGHGWLIFALPPGEAAFHPADKNDRHELYFMCDSLQAEMAALAKQGVKCSAVQQERWGSITKVRLPGGGEIGLYQPKHPTALGLGAK